MAQGKVGDDRLLAAHQALGGGGEIQFTLPPAKPPQPPPQWLIDFLHSLGQALRPVGRFFRWLNGLLPDAPYARIFFWGMIALLAGLALWLVITRLRRGQWRWPLRRTVLAGEDWPEEEAAPAALRAWLDEADALAARGLYAAAVHHLLLRSVDDLAARRPNLVRPSTTARDLSRAEAVPQASRALFGTIVRVVEPSLFGGRAVAVGEWEAARATYAEFADSWGRAR